MSNTWKRLLSLLLAFTMILSLGVTGFAQEDEGETAEEPAEEGLVPDEEGAPEESDSDGSDPEMFDISPDKLNVPKLGREETADEDEELTSADDTMDLNQIVRVSIFLEESSTLGAGYPADGVGTNGAAIAYRDGLKAQHETMKAAIAGVIGHELNVHWDLTLAVNAISADVTLGEMVKIAEIPGVKAVQRENQYLPMEGETADPDTANTSENMVGATAAWAAGYTGAGSRIAIIDTGIDTSHQSFAEEPFTYSVGLAGATGELMTRNEVQGLAGQLNSGSGNYVSAKIPYGYNYVDGNTIIDHVHDTEGDHGSHVAGIAAANRFIGTAHNDAAATVGAVGMAPDAQLLIMKVFGANGGAYDSDYMVAIEDAIVLGADVCNLSLGSGSQGWTFDNQYQDQILNWANGEHNGKMVLSISAGNAYDLAFNMDNRYLYLEDVSMHTGGSPGSFINSLCVAAAQNTLQKGTPMNFNGNQDVYYYESTGDEEEGTTYTNPELKTIAGDYTYVYIDATGTPEDYSAVNSVVSLSGKVVIVNRGDLSFSEKGNNAKSYNPKAVIVANSADGAIYMNLADYTGTFPMVSISLKDANKIKAGGTAHTTASGVTYYTGDVTVTNVETEVVIERSEATITDFSSWGVPGSLLMKPEITAPGGDIYSVYGTANKPSGGTEGGEAEYVSFSGTSMAAPHIAGLTGVLAEYQRENDLVALCAELGGYSTRAIAQSLMMSTATPMAPGGEYLPVLQQGAGLADVSLAVTSNSVIMMDPENSGLTGKTGAAADGKVKVELGDDPVRKGDYSFGFTVYNLTDDDLHFNVETDLFTQGILVDNAGELLMSRGTILLNASDSFWWAPIDGSAPVEGHDVDQDGDTDKDDAQAILDYLTGEREEDELDLTVADLDEDELITSLDAYLLLGWESEEGGEGYGAGVVPAHGSRYCAVRITLSDEEKADLDFYFTGGAYLEGFTYVTCDTTGKDGAVYADEHSIPILGFYGSWTDANMFDTASYTDKLYGSQQVNYSRNGDTNYLTLQMNGANLKFSGNPYMVENEFPADRLAINSNTAMMNIAYNLVRAAGTIGFAVTRLDEDHQVTEVISSAVTGNQVTGIWYSPSTGSWNNMTQKLYNVNKAPSAYGLSEGDRFRVGFYAIPEYNAMLVNDDYTSASAGVLDKSGFDTLLLSNELGQGAFVGFDFVVDNTDPQVVSANLEGSELTVTATDDRALAYVAILSLDGETVYSEFAPGEDEYTVTIDASDAIANAFGYVAVFAGDYAGNEAAVAVKVNDNNHVERTIYIQTDTIASGEEYVIANTMTPGSAYALGHRTTTTLTNGVTVKTGDSGTQGKPYIETTDVASTSVWTAGNGSSSGTWTFNNGGYYLRRSNNNNLTITTDSSRRDWTWDGANNRLSMAVSSWGSTTNYYLRYYNNTFSINTATNSVFLFQKVEQNFDIDPYGVSSVTITPGTLDLYKGDTADLTAKVLPLTATDRTVTWSSANTSVATVDEFGKVTAVGKGTTTVRATANGDPTKFAECTVKVEAIDKNLNGIVWDEEGAVWFSSFNASNLPTWNKLHGNAVGTYLTSAFMFNASSLYAGTLDSSSATTTLYSVNRSTYALTEYSENYVGAFGIARGITGFSSQGYNFIVYGFAKYLIMGNLDPDHEDPNDDSSAMYSGLPYGLLDLTETDVGDAYVCGVCAKTVGSTSATYYFLDETGKIWQTTLSYSNSDGFVFSAPTLEVDTGIGTSILYQSIYYDGTYLYWTHTTGEDCQLIIYAPSTGKLYNAGNFGDGVWPVAGIYVNGSAAPAAVEDELMIENLELRPMATRDELMTEDVIKMLIYEFALWGIDLQLALPAPAEEPEDFEDFEDEEPVEEPEEPVEEPEEPVEEPEEPIEEPAPVEGDEGEAYTGSLMVFRGNSVSAGVPSVVTTVIGGEFNEEEKEPDVSIPVMESEDSHNGLIAVVYDPEAMSFLNFEANENVSIISVHVDEDKGIITIAYANVLGDDELPVFDTRGGESDLIPAETAIVTLNFTIGCEDSVGEVQTLERNDELELDEIEDLTVFGTGHDWGEPTWTWAEDYSTATATFVCANDETHTQTLETASSSEVVGNERVYTATVTLDGVTYTDTRSVPLTVTVTFDAGAGTVDPATVEVNIGGSIGELPVPTREKWVFLGWYMTPAATQFVIGQGTQVTAETSFDEDTTVYAHWRLPGDVNGDGKVNMTDVTLLSTYVKARGTGVTIVPFSGNIDGDANDKVNMTDVTLLSTFVKARGTGVEIH
jgi:lactocepin